MTNSTRIRCSLLIPTHQRGNENELTFNYGTVLGSVFQKIVWRSA